MSYRSELRLSILITLVILYIRISSKIMHIANLI